MSITSDIRSYADSAVSQGKQVLDQNVSGITEKASDITGKATEAVTDLRATAEKAVNLDAIKHAVEPYLAQVKGYGTLVTDRAEELFSGLTSDQRVTKLVDAAGNVTTVVLSQVQQRVVKPVQSLTGFGAPPAKPARVTKPAVTKPAATRRPATAVKASPKPRATAAKTTRSTATAKTTARKAPAKSAPKA